MASANWYMLIARVTRFTFSVSSTSRWEPNFSSNVATGSRPVGGQILTSEVVGCRSPDFVRLRNRSFRPLWGARGASMLISACNHLGDLRGDFCEVERFAGILFLPHVSGVPQMV